MRFAVATLWRFNPARPVVPRFFNGAYDARATRIGTFRPMTTGRVERAREYTQRIDAELVAALFNAFDGLQAGARRHPWFAVELPEAWI
jgi:hypothetical protein